MKSIVLLLLVVFVEGQCKFDYVTIIIAVAYLKCFSPTAMCDPTCQNGGVCVGPNICLCLATYAGPICEDSKLYS